MTMQRTPLNLRRLLERGPRISPDEEIVTLTSEGRHRQTYGETASRAARLAGALRRLGVGPGDRVASFMWNGVRHLELYLAVPSMGAVLHTLNIRLGAGDLEYIINHAEDRVVLVDEDLVPLLAPLAARLPSVRQWVIVPEPGAESRPERGTAAPEGPELPGAITLDALIEGESDAFPWPELDENAPLGLCYTSGTTGHPKGVMYTHRSTYLHTITQAMTDVMSLSATDSICGIVPMFHAMGWGLPFTATMLGAKQVMPHRFMDPRALLELMAAEEVTVSAGVPTIWQNIRAILESEPGRHDLSSLERLVCGGSAPPVALMRWYWDTLGVEMIQGWGMTETNPLGTIARRLGKYKHRRLDPEAQFRNVTRAGLVMPGLEIEIVDDAFHPLPHDGRTIGELLIRGPWVCAEYYRDPQPEKFHDGWLVTGDIAAIDEEEYLIIADRSKDLVKSGGEWISSVDLENHIMGLEGVRQAAVVAQPHPKWDERPVAIVVLAPGANVTPERIREHCLERFARWQLPDDVLYWDEIPLTSTGKMDKKAIRARLAEEGYVLPALRA